MIFRDSPKVHIKLHGNRVLTCRYLKLDTEHSQLTHIPSFHLFVFCSCQRDANITGITAPYAWLSLNVAQATDSWEIITEIDPLEIAEIFGNIGGFWGEQQMYNFLQYIESKVVGKALQSPCTCFEVPRIRSAKLGVCVQTAMCTNV